MSLWLNSTDCDYSGRLDKDYSNIHKKVENEMNHRKSFNKKTITYIEIRFMSINYFIVGA